ncbi:hypothetical protein [Chitinivorax sp. B]|uniref:hypothetical protein n=1 Tax=Chitinivorax sp. B TaxID=2502235 RepID=UPI0010F7112C|nr:hypothetical protein [Chitinivorax sp. B]
MTSKWKWALFSVAGIILSWMIAFAIWQQAQRPVSITELLLFGALIPVLAGTGIWMLGRHLSNSASTPTDTSVTSFDTTSPNPAKAMPETTQQQPIYILDSSLICLGGRDLDGVRDHAQQHPLPDLDPELTDEDGYPIRSYRADVDIPPNLATPPNQSDQDHHEARTARMRALLGQALESLQDTTAALAAQATASSPSNPSSSPQSAQMHPGWHGTTVTDTLSTPQSSPSISISIRLFLGTANLSAATPLLSDIRNWLGTFPGGEHCEVKLTQCDHAGHLPQDLATFANRASTESHGQVMIALAAHSDLDQTIIESWQQKGWLGGRQGGKVPGEVACGLIFANHKDCVPEQVASAQFDSIQSLVRQKPANASGRIDTLEMANLLRSTNTVSPFSATTDQQVWVDSEALSSGAAELGQWWLESFPDTPDTQLIRLGSAWGPCGTAGQLALMVATAQATAASAQPQLAVMAADPIYRSMCLMRPVAA